ncbi:hypothetical protein [Glycomyces tarimensis]
MELPMTPEALDLMLRAWADAAELLAPAPPSLLDVGVERRPMDDSQEGPIEGVSPYLREHQRWSGLVAADWLAHRRHW